MGAEIQKTSSYYETEAWGASDLNSFINSAAQIEWNGKPHDLLRIIKGIESSLGRSQVDKSRQKSQPYQNRTIDIDILYMDDVVLEADDLILPHPYLQDRRFVLLPLAEIAPYYKDPRNDASVKELLYHCKDSNKVEKLT